MGPNTLKSKQISTQFSKRYIICIQYVLVLLFFLGDFSFILFIIQYPSSILCVRSKNSIYHYDMSVCVCVWKDFRWFHEWISRKYAHIRLMVLSITITYITAHVAFYTWHIGWYEIIYKCVCVCLCEVRIWWRNNECASIGNVISSLYYGQIVMRNAVYVCSDSEFHWRWYAVYFHFCLMFYFFLFISVRPGLMSILPWKFLIPCGNMFACR